MQRNFLIRPYFLEKFSKRYGIHLNPLEEFQKQQILTYHWPGNVRELQNVMERCVITNQNGMILWPDFGSQRSALSEQTQIAISDQHILTEEEMLDFERRNIMKALQQTDWKISGNKGAAALLKIPATTLASRITKLKIAKH